MDEILKLFGGTENIWAAIQKNAKMLGVETTRVLLELFYVLKSPTTGMLDKTLIIAALGYQLLPEDVLPRDKYGWLGFIDNGAALALAYNRVKSSVTPEIEQQVNNILQSWFGESSMPQSSFVNTEEQVQILNPAPQVTEPTPPSPTKRPIWNDDEDVVID